MPHPYADLIGLTIDQQENGQSRCSLVVVEKLLNPHQVLHGAVLYALADTGIGAALYPSLQSGELCATIEIKINYLSSCHKGERDLSHPGTPAGKIRSKFRIRTL